MDWLLVGLLILLIIVYVIMQTGNTKQQPEVEELRAETLMVKVYFGRETRSALANLQDFEKDGTIWVTVFETQPIVNEVQRQAQGKWARVGKAVVRVNTDTNEVMSWTRLD